MTPRRVLAPLREPRFRTLCGGQSFALLGAEFQLVALAWLALELTSSGLALGSVLVAGMLPRVGFTLAGGLTADRLDFRLVMMIGNAARAAVVAGFAVVVGSGVATLWHLYAVAVVLGCVTSFYQPALYTAVPKVCPPDLLMSANAVLRGCAETIGTAGPLAAGVMVASVGTGSALWVTAGCYAIATVALAGVSGEPSGRVAAAPAGERRSLLADLRTGVATVRRDPFLVRMLVLIAAAGLALTGPVTVGVPWLARHEFGAGAATFGLLLSMWAAGALLGSVTVASLRRPPGWRTLIPVVCGTLSAAMAGTGFAGHALVAAATLLVMGAAAGFFNVVLLTLLQRRTEPAVLGRMMSFVELAEVATTPVSYLLAGLFLDISVPALFAVAAALLLICAMWTVRSGPTRRTDPEGDHHAEPIAAGTPGRAA